MSTKGFFCRRTNRARKFMILPGGVWRSFADDPGAADAAHRQMLDQLEQAGVSVSADLPPETVARLLDVLTVDGIIRPATGSPAAAPAFSERRTAGQAGAMSSQRRRQLLSCSQRGKQLLAKEDKKNREHRQFAEALGTELKRLGVRLP